MASFLFTRSPARVLDSKIRNKIKGGKGFNFYKPDEFLLHIDNLRFKVYV